MKTVTLTEFLTRDEIARAYAIYETAEPEECARLIDEEVIEPQMARINRVLDQENDARYLAYLCQHVFVHIKNQQRKETSKNDTSRN